ncbi:MAG: Ig-like domain-containing protein [Muribaculaceae bacterium]|nr:Ig-like domain-containing protein [Muribaculaceae bacterium]
MNNGNPNSSYGTYKSKNGWVATNSALLSGQDEGSADSNPRFSFIGGADTFAPTLNGKVGSEGTLTSPVIPDGLGTLKFNWGLPFADSKISFTVNVKQNNEIVKTDTYSNSSLQKQTVYVYEFNADVLGDFVIEIVNNALSGSTSNSDRLSIWNLSWTNCEVAKANPELAFATETVNVTGLNANFVAPELTYKTNGTLTWNSSNPKVATVDNAGKVTLVNYGSATITVNSAATDTYSAGSAAYTIVITPGTISVAKALELLGEGLTFNATVEGYVSKVDSYNSTYGSLTYWMVDQYDAATAGNTENALQVYSGLWKEGAKFTGTSDLTPGASISVQGSLKTYNSTPEFDLNSVVVSYDDSNIDNGNEDTGSEEPGEEPGTDNDYESVTFDFTELGSLKAYDNGVQVIFNDEETIEYNVTGYDFVNSPITITGMAQEGAANTPRLYLSSGNWGYRFYNDNTVTIASAEGYVIKSIEFSATNLGNSSIQWEGEGLFSKNVWVSDENIEVTEVIISKTATGNNPVISKVTVYYDEAASDAINGLYNENTEVEVYTLHGIRVNPSNLSKGIYIIRQGNKTSKVMVR